MTRRRASSAALLGALLVAQALVPTACSGEDAAPTGAPGAKPAPAEAVAAPQAASRKPLPEPAPTGKVRPCAGAGKWFPAGRDELRKAVDAYLAVEAPPIGKRPVALIVPHAGYRFSGPCAGRGYAALKGHDYDRVILMGLSHTRPLAKASVLRVDAYETPLGRVPVDLAAVEALLACPVVTEQPACHEVEWSTENQLPFLQRAVGDFKVVELLVGDLAPDERAALAKAVHDLADEKTLLVR